MVELPPGMCQALVSTLSTAKRKTVWFSPTTILTPIQNQTRKSKNISNNKLTSLLNLTANY